MQIKTATNLEASQIIDFQIKMAFETENIDLNYSIVKKGVEAVFLDNSKGKYYVCEHENQIIASLLTTYEWSDWRAKTIVWLQSVYVKPEFRKHGVFKLMYQYIKNMVLENENYCGIKLYVDKTNLNAQKVYNAVGMNGEHYILYEWQK